MQEWVDVARNVGAFPASVDCTPSSGSDQPDLRPDNLITMAIEVAKPIKTNELVAFEYK